MKNTLSNHKIENLQKLKDVTWPYICITVLIAFFFTETFARNNEDYNYILIFYSFVPSALLIYFRRISPNHGIYISSDCIVYRKKNINKKIKWENLFLEITFKSSFPFTRKRFYFRDLKDPRNDFQYELNGPTIKNLKKMISRFLPEDHEIYKHL